MYWLLSEIRKAVLRIADAVAGSGSNSTAEALKRIEALLTTLVFISRRPAPPRGLRVTKEEGNEMATFAVQLSPAEKPRHTDHRELSVSVAGGTPEVRTIPTDDVEEENYMGQFGDAVHVELVDIDASGNRSEAGILDATLVDNMAPPQPGVLGIRVTSEDDPVPPVEPEPEPEV